MGFSDSYRKRMKAAGSTSYDRNYKIKAREFSLYFKSSLNKEDCLIDGVEHMAIFQDHSQSNNKDLSDDKYLILPNEVECRVGSYLDWRSSEWLVFTEEFKTIPTHQQLKIKHVNHSIKWLVDRKKKTVCNEGVGWGVYVQNQTLYTLGVAFTGSHLGLVNAKMMMYMQDNEETRTLSIGSRIYIGNNIYTVRFADYVSRVGLINFLLEEDTRNPETDNYELLIADYWEQGEKNGDKPAKEPEDPNESEKPPLPDIEAWEVRGELRARLGRTYVYKAYMSSDEAADQIKVDEWIVENIDDMPFHILEKNTDSISIRVKDDRRMIGKKAMIMANVAGEFKNIAITIVAKFA